MFFQKFEWYGQHYWQIDKLRLELMFLTSLLESYFVFELKIPLPLF